MKSILNALWHITCHHQYFKERGSKVPAYFAAFADLDDYKSKKLKKPELKVEHLQRFISELSTHLSHPWFSKTCFQSLRQQTKDLVGAMNKVANLMSVYNQKAKERHVSEKPARISMDNTSLSHLKLSNAPVHPKFEELYNDLDNREPYDPILLARYEPEDRFARFNWLETLTFPFPVVLLKRAYGGNLGTMSFVWKLPEQEEIDETKEVRLVLKISDTLPTYHSRQMRKDFLDRYSKMAKTPPSILKSIYREITGDNSEYQNEHEKLTQKRVAQFIQQCDEADILIDLRKLNGKPNSSKFDPFWDEVNVLFNEYQAAVQERRQGQYLYLPFAISVSDLINQIKTRKPDVDCPSAEWVRLQFTPCNPYTKSALKHTGRFPIKFAVQARQMRNEHVDSKYGYTIFKYLKEFCVQHRENTKLFFVDDKAVIPVGEPSNPVSTNVRRHNKSLVAASGPTLAALDHDWKVAGLVASVALSCEIPESTSDSFYQGIPYVTTKERIFQSSGPFRHAAEMLNIIQADFSTDQVQLAEEILAIYSDGGGDHNVTHGSVQVSLLCLFLQTNVDMLIAIRTCPTQSWVNPAERIMSLLNLALQNVALARTPMTDDFEALIKNKSTMTDVRLMAKRNENLKPQYEKSIEPVVNLINDRFGRMSLKENKVSTKLPATDAQITSLFDIINLIDASVDINKLRHADLLKNTDLHSFISSHCYSTTYTFQIKKCLEESCYLCSLFQPPRLEPEVFKSLSFIPNPMLDHTQEHYKSFQELSGTETSEKDRPSLLLKPVISEADQNNKSLLTSPKVRGTLTCSTCHKPRCFYSNSSLTYREKIAVQMIRETEVYVCGGSLFPSGHEMYKSIVTRESLTCDNAIENAYYGATTIKMVDICNHCGGVSGSPLLNDDSIRELKRKYTRVRPICASCKLIGKVPTTWGALNSLAEKRQKKNN